MSETKIENAQITDTTLGIEGHGIMTAMIGLSGEGWGVGFGGYTFDQWDETQKRRVGVDYGMEFIMRVLHVVGVDSWEKLKGQHVRVVTEGWGWRALKIGHITKDRWFDPQALSDEMRARAVPR